MTEEVRGVEHAYTAQTRVGLAICLWQRGQRDEAIAITERALAVLPEGSQVRAKTEQGLAQWRRVMAGEPSSAP